MEHQHDTTSHPILISGDSGPTPVAVLAGITIDLTRRPRPAKNPIQVMVIDRADRSLIRLRQLPTTESYTTIDDLGGVERSLTQLELHTTSEPPSPGLRLLVVNELGRLLDFFSRSGRRDLGAQLESVLARHDGERLMVAASCSSPELLSASVRATFRSALDCDTEGTGRLADPTGERVIDLRDWAPDRVTTAVASIIQAVA